MMQNLRRFWVYIRPDAWLFALTILLMPVQAGLGIAQPLVLKKILDEHLVVGKAEGLQSWALVWLGLVVAAFLVQCGYVLALSFVAENSILRLRQDLYKQILSLSQRFYEGQPTGQIMTRATSDVDALSESITMGSVSLLLDLLTMLGVLVAMALLDWRMTLLLLCLGPPLGAVIEVIRRRMRVLYAEIRDALAALNAFLAERLAGVEVIQLYGQEARAQARFEKLDASHRDANVRNNFYDAFLYAFIDGVTSMCTAMIIAFGAWELGEGKVGITVGLVVAFVDYVERLFRPLREFSSKVTFLQRAGAALDKIFWLLGVEDRITAGDSQLSRPSGSLSIRNVSFRYKPEAPAILQDIHLELHPGEVVAVVGRTGAGKSTLVRLLARIHDGYTGSILVDGIELSRIAPASVRRAIGMVRQEVQLFSDTLRFNVTLGDPSLDPARVEEAVQLSNLAVVAARHPDGMERKIRDRGGDLSAGEAQILALARTLARDPAIVILDEATASVDPVTEQLLQAAIARVFERKTCLVIAHRLSTIVGADRIVVLDQGRVVEQGSHAELIALGGAYASLYQEGFGGPTAEPEAPSALSPG
jgi:ATP-binding cassette, subfamily B, multidrug efflux pump